MAVSSLSRAFVCELADLDFSTVVAGDVRQVLPLALAAIATLPGLQELCRPFHPGSTFRVGLEIGHWHSARPAFVPLLQISIAAIVSPVAFTDQF